MNIVLLINMVIIAFDTPHWKNFSGVLRILNIIMFGFFTVEALLKIIALGFLNTSLKRKAYMCDILNVLDLVLVIVHGFDVMMIQTKTEKTVSDKIIHGLLSVRVLRLLVPLS